MRADGGGVDRPSAELCGDVNADTGEFSAEGILLSKSCSGRGPVGDVKEGEAGGAVTVPVLISCRSWRMSCKRVMRARDLSLRAKKVDRRQSVGCAERWKRART